jgi:hypothetical protein
MVGDTGAAVGSERQIALYETPPKWHGFLRIKLAAFQASDAAYMKLRLAGTANRLNVEHRTPNIERRILMALRFIESKTNESQNLEGWFCFAKPFLIDRIHYWMLDVQCSMFDVHFLVNTSY